MATRVQESDARAAIQKVVARAGLNQLALMYSAVASDGCVAVVADGEPSAASGVYCDGRYITEMKAADLCE